MTGTIDKKALEAAWMAASVALRAHMGETVGPIARAAIMQVVLAAGIPAYLEAVEAAQRAPCPWIEG